MPELFQSNSIAIGANNVAGLTNIEAIAVDGVYFVAVNDLDKWREGAPVLYGDGIGGRQGITSTRWVSGFITAAQYNYIRTTLLVNSFSAEVTIRTRTYSDSTYANYSGVLTIPSPDELDAPVGGKYADFVWQFTKLVLIP